METYEKNKMLTLLYRIFQAEKYEWRNKNGEEKVPTFEEIEQAIQDLEERALSCKGSAGSGRIMVEYDKNFKDFDYYLNLGGR